MLGGFSFQQRLNVGSSDDYVLTFVRGDERRFVAWTVSATPHQLTIPNLAGGVSITAMTGNDSGRIASIENRLIVNVSQTPLYLTPVSY
jgi:hypothetical protein